MFERKSQPSVTIDVNLNSLTCPISLDYLFDPVLTSCGHAMESSSYAHYSSKNCPECRTPFSITQGENMGVVFNEVLNNFYKSLTHLPKEITDKNLNLPKAFINKPPKSEALIDRMTDLIAFNPLFLKDVGNKFNKRQDILEKLKHKGVFQNKECKTIYMNGSANTKTVSMNINLTSLICPITRGFMIDPVLASCGHAFESYAMSNDYCIICNKNVTLKKGAQIGAVFNEVLNSFYEVLPKLPKEYLPHMIVPANLILNLPESSQILERLAQALAFNSEMFWILINYLVENKPDFFKKIITTLIKNEQWDFLKKLGTNGYLTADVVYHNLGRLVQSEEGIALLTLLSQQANVFPQHALNYITEEGDSLALWLSLSPNGRILLDTIWKKYDVSIESKTFNSISKSSHFNGYTVAYGLAENPLSCELFLKLMQKGIFPTNDVLNCMVDNPDRIGSSLAFELAASIPGRMILSLLLLTEGFFIKSETLNTIPTRGMYKHISMAACLTTKMKSNEFQNAPDGISILSLLMEKNVFIQEKTLNQIIEGGALANCSVASLLASDKIGLQLLAELVKRNILINEETLNADVRGFEDAPANYTLALQLADSELGKDILRNLLKKGCRILDQATKTLLGGFLCELNKEIKQEAKETKTEAKQQPAQNTVLSSNSLLTFPMKRKLGVGENQLTKTEKSSEIPSKRQRIA